MQHEGEIQPPASPATAEANGIEGASIRYRRPLDPDDHIATRKGIQSLRDPRSVRAALGLSLAAMGEALGDVHPNGHGGKPFNKGAVWAWETYPATSRKRAKQFRMTDYTREAYRLLVADAVAIVSGGRLTVRAKMGPNVWRFDLVGRCKTCGKEFSVKRSGQVNCLRCQRRGKA